MSPTRTRPPGAPARPRPPAFAEAKPLRLRAGRLGSGARLRRDRSLSADAQRRYRAAAGDEAIAGVEPTATPTPTPNPSPQPPRSLALAGTPAGGGEPAVLGEGQENITPLTQEARALYEGGVVPVREVARLCGVSPRTLYYHVHRQGWRRRRADEPRDPAKAERQRKRYQALKATRPPRPRGMKARDPAGQADALLACERAAALSGAALARAIARRDAESDARLLSILVQALRGFTRRAAKPPQAREKKRDVDKMRAQLWRKLRAAAAGWEAKDDARSPAQPESEPESEQDRRINAIAARYYARRGRE